MVLDMERELTTLLAETMVRLYKMVVHSPLQQQLSINEFENTHLAVTYDSCRRSTPLLAFDHLGSVSTFFFHHNLLSTVQ